MVWILVIDRLEAAQFKRTLKKSSRQGVWEDGRIGSIRNLSPRSDNNYTGRIYLMYLFWNHRVS